jgi:hypothetical protein
MFVDLGEFHQALADARRYGAYACSWTASVGELFLMLETVNVKDDGVYQMARVLSSRGVFWTQHGELRNA